MEGAALPKDFGEFEKLFKIPVPKLSEAAYYLSTLAQSKEYAQVWELAEAFVQMEDWLVNVEQKHRTITNYKMSAMAKIKDAIAATAAHQRDQLTDWFQRRWAAFKTADMKVSIADTQRHHQRGDEWFLSIDLSSANFTTMLLFDDEKALCGSWPAFLEKLGVHPTLAKSKHYRQMVMGHLNPRHNGKIQKMIMGYVVKHLRQALKEQLPAESFIFLSNDEVVMKCGQGEEADEATLKFISAIYAALAEPIGIFEGKTIALGKQFKITLYKMKAFNRKGQCVKTIYTPIRADPASIDLAQPVVGLVEDFSSLWGVPGTRFYLCFKKHILQAPFDRRDLYFFVEGHLAMWVVDSFDELDDSQEDGNPSADGADAEQETDE